MSDTLENATAAADQIHEALTFANDHLGRVSTRLEKEYVRRHARSPSHSNPYNVLSRIRTLKNELPQLKQELLQCHEQKRDIVNAIRVQMQNTRRFSEQTRPLLSSAIQSSQSDSLTDRLSQLGDHLQLVAQVFPPALTNNDKEYAHPIISSTRSDGQLECQSASLSASEPSPEETTKKAKSNRSSVTPISGNSKSELKRVDKRHEVTFKPVTKAAFNRLPRNIKIRAGKLADINQCYEGVFNKLSNSAGGCLSDAKLMDATGEKNTERFQVLRGLAVLRHGKEGWSLAANK